MPDDHASHGEMTLSLSEQTPDNGLIFRSWTVCTCTGMALRAKRRQRAMKALMPQATVKGPK